MDVYHFKKFLMWDNFTFIFFILQKKNYVVFTFLYNKSFLTPTLSLHSSSCKLLPETIILSKALGNF